MLLVPLAADFGTLWVAVELTTIVSALLVAIDRTDAALEASWKYVPDRLPRSRASRCSRSSCSTRPAPAAARRRLRAALRALPAHAHALPRRRSSSRSCSPRSASVRRSASSPMHTWLPDAHSEAPTPVSALLSGSLLAAALYAILRFYQVTVRGRERRTSPSRVLLVFGGVSLVAAACTCCARRATSACSPTPRSSTWASSRSASASARRSLSPAPAARHHPRRRQGLAFFGAGSILRRYDTKEIDGVTGRGDASCRGAGRCSSPPRSRCRGLPVSGVFRSEFQIVAAASPRPSTSASRCCIVLVNLAFLGVIWHAARMVLSRPEPGVAVAVAGAPAAAQERAVDGRRHGGLPARVGRPRHPPPGQLGSLLTSAVHRLAVPT